MGCSTGSWCLVGGNWKLLIRFIKICDLFVDCGLLLLVERTSCLSFGSLSDIVSCTRRSRWGAGILGDDDDVLVQQAESINWGRGCAYLKFCLFLAFNEWRSIIGRLFYATVYTVMTPQMADISRFRVFHLSSVKPSTEHWNKFVITFCADSVCSLWIIVQGE